ncbi:MAG: ABC transporter substrate-binding protein [Sphaerochaetaceae bacterium]|jgi:peptide/nickel transport system substrate-binding protein|nr:ABC transporter substrate-binding protein [Sphaerochaetaceae bacterium]MDD4842601.1 ABC transporter substrate-binding protein [Sphaerochaetaceae bacterium]MDX9933902.1 ABC transporter substrate-binding protein [Sphaerochaetaceae bacterium]
MKKTLVLVLLLCLSVAVFAGGKTEVPVSTEPSQATAPKMAEKQVYREALLKAAQGQSSFITTTAHRLDSTVNEPMVALTWKGDLKPMIAESFEMLEDGKVWIMHIRDNATWHDGTDVTAADVIFSYSAYANPRVASRWNGKAQSIKGYADVQKGLSDKLSGVTAIDDKTVRIELSQAMPLWMKLEQTFLVIFPDHILGKVPADQLVAHGYWKNRVGTGPFKWAEYKPDQYIRVVRNDDYYLGAPILEEIQYVIFGDVPSQLNALASGQIHTTVYESNTITPNEAPVYEAMPNISVVTMSKGANAFLALNLDRPDWADVRIRQALCYALDIPTILNAIYPGAIPAYTLFPQEWTWPATMNKYEYNPEKAKALLAEAGWSGRTVDLIYYHTDDLTKNLLVAIQQYFKAVGVNVELRQVDAAYNTAFYPTDQFDASFGGNGMGLDPVTGENLIMTGELLSMRYANPTIDELLMKGKALADQEDRAPLYQQVSAILNEEVPKIFMWYDIRNLGFSDKVVGPKAHWAEQGTIYFNQPIYNEVEKWYVID